MAAVELVVTDLDGTFWHTDDHVPVLVLEAAAALATAGIPLLVATGRRLASTRGPLARFGLAPPAVVLNGALGVDLASGQRFHRSPFSTEEALAAYDAFTSVGLSPVVYVDHPRYDVFISHSPDTNPEHVKALGDSAGRRWSPATREASDDLRQTVAGEAVLGFSLIGVPYGPAEAAYEALLGHAEVHLDRSLDFPGLASLTAAPLNQSKWDGVLAFCSERGIDSSKVLAVADGPNDVELLDGAAVRLVPEVAHRVALERATHVIPAAADGGWAAVLDHIG